MDGLSIAAQSILVYLFSYPNLIGLIHVPVLNHCYSFILLLLDFHLLCFLQLKETYLLHQSSKLLFQFSFVPFQPSIFFRCSDSVLLNRLQNSAHRSHRPLSCTNNGSLDMLYKFVNALSFVQLEYLYPLKYSLDSRNTCT